MPPDVIPEILDRATKRLGGITYRIATKKDYRTLHAFMAEQEAERNTLGFPTVLAEKDGEILGLLGTLVKSNLIIAGPLVIKKDRPRYFTIIRLVEAYEAAMLSLGVTSYIFGTSDPKFLQYAKELGLESYAEKDGISFFIRKL